MQGRNIIVNTSRFSDALGISKQKEGLLLCIKLKMYGSYTIPVCLKRNVCLLKYTNVLMRMLFWHRAARNVAGTSGKFVHPLICA
jgi:hypothetical protein